MPGVDPVDAGWLKVSKADDAEGELADYAALVGQEFGGRGRGLAGRTRARGAQEPSLFPRHASPATRFIFIRSIMRSGSRRRRKRRARASSRHAGALIDAEACASACNAVARVRAGHVVLAGNVHVGALMPRVGATLMPIWTYVIVTASASAPAPCRGGHLSRRG